MYCDVLDELIIPKIWCCFYIKEQFIKLLCLKNQVLSSVLLVGKLSNYNIMEGFMLKTKENNTNLFKISDYKSSRYNWCCTYDSNCLLLNTLSWKIYKIKKSIFSYLQNMDTPSFDISINEMKVLIKEGLLVKNDIKEELIMHHYINMSKYDRDLKVTIVPTEACNFRCVYCYQNHETGHMNDESEEKIKLFFKNNVRKYNSVNIEWFGGEPLLQKERVIRISQYIKQCAIENHVPIVGSMTTNGYYLDYSTFEKLVSNNILYYQITLDGPREIHDRQRPLASGKGTYDVITSNLNEIKNKFKKKHVKIAIRINVSKENSEYIEKFLFELDQRFGSDKRFIFLLETVKDWGGNSIKQLESSLFANRNQLNDLLSSEDHNFKFTLYDEVNESLSNRMCHSYKSSGFVLNYDAEVYKCAKAMYENNTIKELNKVGELTINGKLIIDEIKNSQWMSQECIKEECENCCWLPACITMHCPLTDILNKQPKCLYKDNGMNLYNMVVNAYKNNKFIEIGK